ncbi:MAG: hypothetical protein KDB13_11805 [Microthrixaceae bacterium]|nr:hypothetical protein [Microthrixaceae bacterium]
MTESPPSTDDLERCERLLTAWLDQQLTDNPAVVATERDPERDTRRWLLRVEGEEKKVFTIWFELRQRSLHAETYLAPAPLEPPERAQEYLLRSMSRFRALSAWIGLEAAFYVGTDTLVEDVSEERLDRVLGSIYEATEALFVPLMRLGYGDRFKP